MGIYGIDHFETKEAALEYYAKGSSRRMDEIIRLFQLNLDTGCDVLDKIEKLSREQRIFEEHYRTTLHLIIAEAKEES